MSESPLFPAMLDLADRPVLLVGAGRVALRKAGQLLACGARVTVLAPEIDPGFDSLPVTIERRPFAPGDTSGFRLVLTATGDTAVDQAIFDEADAAGLWVNSADDPERCSYILPAVHRQGPITISVSTAGSSPALASWLRAELGALIGPEFSQIAEELASERAAVQATGASTEDIDWRPIIESKLREHGLGPLAIREDVR